MTGRKINLSETITLLVHGAFYRGDEIQRRVLTVRKQENLYTILKREGLYLYDCSGNGTCGKCRVRFLKDAPLPTAGERVLLSAEELRAGVRLACRHTVRADLELALEMEPAQIPDVIGVLPDMERAQEGTDEERTAEGTDGELLLPGERPATGRTEERPGADVLYAAVDIGTTTVAMRAMCCGQEVAAYAALNPQRAYGADVVSRIRAGIQGHAEDMRRQICSCLADGIKLITEQCGRKPEYMVIAANTTMVHLLCGESVEPLSAYPFEPVNIRPQQIVVAGIPAYIICGISAFVGGDIVSGMAATGLHNADNLQLFIDLGTNGEIVLGKKGKFLCTATAAGPAFEGNGSADLMGADLIRIAADLLDEGVMDAQGLLCEPFFSKGIDRTGAHILQEHIRELQKAKAAVAAGIDLLLEQYGAPAREITHVLLAGGFGYYLRPDSAIRIGLLPKAFEGRVRAVGNTALQGACLIGGRMQGSGRSSFASYTQSITADCRYLNLAMQENFEKKYISNLDFPS